mmetsp:Transcript_40190/g.45737  ORF Transcript_40190/g.45737 Transcript_40190/m.45737 type:complete len:275 (+) Transcript_40190:39-863(+)
MWPILLLVAVLILGMVSSQKIGIPAELLAKALNHAAASDGTQSKLVQNLRNGDIDSLYGVAKSMHSENDPITSVLIWHQLADSSAHHIPSMVALGFAYSEGDKPQAIKYFVQAGEDGPHQGALYNAGRLFAEIGEITQALAYIRYSANLGKDEKTAMYAASRLSETAAKAYHILSDQILKMIDELSLQQMIDIFPYSNINDIPIAGGEVDKIWKSAIESLQAFTRTGVHDQVENSIIELIKLQNLDDFSKIQKNILRSIISKSLELSNIDKSEL